MSEIETQLYDAVVVGLGPVGAAAALLLVQEGLRVLAVEPSPDPYDKPRAFGLDHESLRLMQKIGIADELAPFLGTYRPSEYRSASGELLRRIVPQAEPFPLSWPPYNTFVQPELERLLRARFADFPTLDVRFGWKVASIEQDEAAATVGLVSATSDETRTVRSRYLVGCDGAWSPTRVAAGLDLEDLAFDEPWLVIDMRVHEDADLPEATVQFCDPARPASFIHGPGTMRRWEIMLLPGEEPTAMLEEERMWSLLSRWLTPDQGTIWRAATYRFHALVATQWRKDRVFIAGDAAHQTPPFMAQGLNQGFRDVANLSWKLGQVVRRGAPQGLLDTYDRERRPNARAVVEVTKTIGRLICERDPDAATRRDAALLEEMRKGRGEIVRQDLLPPLPPGPLILEDRAERSLTGTVCPQPIVHTPAGPRRLDDAIDHRFLMLVAGSWESDAATLELASQLDVTIARLGGNALPPVIAVQEVGTLLSDWMAANSLVAALARPDHVLFGVAREAGAVTALLRALAAALTRGVT